MIRVKKLIILILTIGLFLHPVHSFAYGEKSHGQLIELIAQFYGFDSDLAKQQASFNEGFDLVFLADSVNAILGGISNKFFHFSGTIRPDKKRPFLKRSDIFIEDLSGEVIQDIIGEEIPRVGNPGSFLLVNRGLLLNEYKEYAIGMHRALDLLGAHDGYWPSLNFFTFKIFGRVISPLSVSVGHLHDGTEPDRITFEKFKLIVLMLGGPLIAARERQLQAGGNGINTEWLQKLQSEGVDINDPQSMYNWIINNETIKKYFENLNASQNSRYQIALIENLKEKLLSLCTDKKSAETLIENYKNNIQDDLLKPANVVLYEIIDSLWASKLLNEKLILRNINRPISNAKSLSDFIMFGEEVKEIKLENGKPIPGTREWIIVDIVSRYFNNYVSFPWDKHNSAYLNEIEHVKEIIENDAIENARFELFQTRSLFVESPRSKYFSKVYAQFRKNIKNKRYGITDLKYIILEACDAVINTKIAPEGTQVYTLTWQDKIDVVKVILKTYWYGSRETPAGGWDFVSPKQLPTAIANLQKEYREKEFIPSELIQKWNERRNLLNDKYNNEKVQVGFVQKSAVFLKNHLEGRSVIKKSLACEKLY